MKYYYKYLVLIFASIVFSTIAHAQCSLRTDPLFDGDDPNGDWYDCPAGSTNSVGPGPGFPGNPNPIALQEVAISSPANQDANSGYPIFPVVPQNLPEGWSVFLPRTASTQPCPGDPMKSPAIAPSSPGNVKGGRFGYTRNGGTKFHDGTDIAAVANTPLYSMYGGTVTGVRTSFQPNEYAIASYGNYIEIESNVNGTIVYLKYNHLNGVGQGITVGTQITQGQLIGITGTTGNAADPGVVNKHLHIQAKDENGNKEDPETFIGTKFDKTTGKVTSSPC
jgi:murein DD-endopeptidase MepM/ murein hydrolase activator NlpD